MPARTRKRARCYVFPTQALLDHFPPGTSSYKIADLIGAEVTTVENWRRKPMLLSTYQADRYAINLGEHPSMIWTNWFDLPDYEPHRAKEILGLQ